MFLLMACFHAPPKPATRPTTAAPQQRLAPAPVPEPVREPAPVPEPVEGPARDVIAWQEVAGGFRTAWIRDGQVVAERPELVVYDGELLVWVTREVSYDLQSCACSTTPPCCDANPVDQPEDPAECIYRKQEEAAALVSLETGELVHHWDPSGWDVWSLALVGGVGGSVLVQQTTLEQVCGQEFEIGGPFPAVAFHGVGGEWMPDEVADGATQRAHGPVIVDMTLMAVTPVRQGDRIVAATWAVAVTSCSEDDPWLSRAEIALQGPVPESWDPWVEPHPGLAAWERAGIEGWNEIPADGADELLALFRSAAAARWPADP